MMKRLGTVLLVIAACKGGDDKAKSGGGGGASGKGGGNAVGDVVFDGDGVEFLGVGELRQQSSLAEHREE